MASTQRPPLQVSVFSDYICPFCYVGSRRLLRLRDAYDLRVNWCGVEIHPDTPEEGMPVERLGYPAGRWSALLEGLSALAAEEGLSLAERRFTTRSRRALLLAEATKACGRETFYALHERLFDAFFREGRNIGRAEVLRDLARECAVPEETVDAAWEDPRYPQRLRTNLRHAVELGLRGTPAYVFGREVIEGVVPETDLRAAAERLVAAGPEAAS